MKNYAALSIFIFIIEFAVSADALERWRVSGEEDWMLCWLLIAVTANIAILIGVYEVERYRKEKKMEKMLNDLIDQADKTKGNIL